MLMDQGQIMLEEQGMHYDHVSESVSGHETFVFLMKMKKTKKMSDDDDACVEMTIVSEKHDDDDVGEVNVILSEIVILICDDD